MHSIFSKRQSTVLMLSLEEGFIAYHKSTNHDFSYLYQTKCFVVALSHQTPFAHEVQTNPKSVYCLCPRR